MPLAPWETHKNSAFTAISSNLHAFVTSQKLGIDLVVRPVGNGRIGREPYDHVYVSFLDGGHRVLWEETLPFDSTYARAQEIIVYVVEWAYAFAAEEDLRGRRVSTDSLERHRYRKKVGEYG